MKSPDNQNITTATPAAQSKLGADLMPRVWSALVMGAVALGAVWLGDWPFLVLIAVAGAVVAWEWSKIVRGEADDLTFYIHLGTVIIALVLMAFRYPALAVVVTMAGMIAVAVLTHRRHPVLSATGVAYAALPGLALIWLRADDGLGLMAVVYVVATVIATDTGAYFAGRLIGGPKLWPRVSPKKTWSGLGGGVVAATLVGALIAAVVPGSVTWHLAVFSAVLAVVAQGGDLAESSLKRAFGIKDASSIIPGHGGVMDRVDGLVTAAIVAAAFAAILDVVHPARALLTW